MVPRPVTVVLYMYNRFWPSFMEKTKKKYKEEGGRVEGNEKTVG
jgi:hypothetical protein